MKKNKKLLAILIPLALLGGCNSNSDTVITPPDAIEQPEIDTSDQQVVTNNLKQQMLQDTTVTINNNKIDEILGQFDTTTGQFTKDIAVKYPPTGVDVKKLTYSQASDVRVHLNKLNILAAGYNTPGLDAYHNEEISDAVKKGFEFWLDTGYESDNWWWRDIGFTTAFKSPAILMANVYSDAFNAQLGEYLTLPYTDQKDESGTDTYTGANILDVANIAVYGAAITQDDDLFKAIQSTLSNAFSIISDPKLTGDQRAGIQVDYSYSQHSGKGMQLYLANYGVAYFKSIIDYLKSTSGTEYALNETKQQLLDSVFLDGNAWSVYEKAYDENVTGRFIGDKPTDGMLSLVDDLEKLNTPRHDEVVKLYSWMKNGNSAGNYLAGNKMFWTHDYMVHRRQNYFTSVKMSSSRVVGNEYLNDTGFNNLHTGDNVNYVMVDGEEYKDLFYKNSAYDWRKIPGITAQQISTDLKPLLLPNAGVHQVGGEAFSVGVSDGTYGAAATIFDNHGIKEKKAWFFFDDFYVVLARDLTITQNSKTSTVVGIDADGKYVEQKDGVVNNNDSGIVTTVINQSNLDGTELTKTTNGVYTTVFNDKIGYAIKGDSAQVVEKRESVGEKGIFSLEVKQADLPNTSGDDVEYVVYPDITKTALASINFDAKYTLKETSSIADSSETAAITVSNSDKTVEFVVFYPTTDASNPTLALVDGKNITADSDSLLLIKRDQDGNITQLTASQLYSADNAAQQLKVTLDGKDYVFDFEAGIQSGKSVKKTIGGYAV